MTGCMGVLLMGCAITPPSAPTLAIGARQEGSTACVYLLYLGGQDGYPQQSQAHQMLSNCSATNHCDSISMHQREYNVLTRVHEYTPVLTLSWPPYSRCRDPRTHTRRGFPLNGIFDPCAGCLLVAAGCGGCWLVVVRRRHSQDCSG